MQGNARTAGRRSSQPGFVPSSSTLRAIWLLSVREGTVLDELAGSLKPADDGANGPSEGMSDEREVGTMLSSTVSSPSSHPRFSPQAQRSETNQLGLLTFDDYLDAERIKHEVVPSLVLDHSRRGGHILEDRLVLVRGGHVGRVLKLKSDDLEECKSVDLDVQRLEKVGGGDGELVVVDGEVALPPKRGRPSWRGATDDESNPVTPLR